MYTTAAQVRSLANWSAAVTDAMLSQHLAGAARELAGRLGGVNYAGLAELPPDHERVAAAAEIEACLTIAFAIPALNLFAAADGPVIPKAVEAAEFLFLEPEQAAKQSAIWRERAEARLHGTPWSDEDDPDDPRWYAV